MATWRYDLHLHSEASPDCKTQLPSIIAAARRRGLSGLAVTDHDTMDGVRALDKIWPHEHFQLIHGCERTLTDGSHVIGLFISEPPKAEMAREVIQEIRQQGGLVYVPHPYRAYSGLLGIASRTPEEDQVWVLQNCDIIEVYNSKCTVEENQQALKLLDVYPRAFAASSDAHFGHEIGLACTEFAARLAPDSFTSIAAFAPPAAAAVRLATLRRGPQSATRKMLRQILQACGLLGTVKSLRDFVRGQSKVELERYR